MQLNGDNAVIELNILGQSSPNSREGWDRKWLTVSIKVTLNGFYANFQTELLSDDFIAFIQSLQKALNTLNGEVELTSLEDTLYLKGVINYKGNVEWSGFLVYPAGNGNKLTFKFESDFYQFERIKNELVADLKTYKIM